MGVGGVVFLTNHGTFSSRYMRERERERRVEGGKRKKEEDCKTGKNRHKHKHTQRKQTDIVTDKQRVTTTSL